MHELMETIPPLVALKQAYSGYGNVKIDAILITLPCEIFNNGKHC